jgi:hypothetical protein
MSDDFHCPECGAEVYPNAFGCRACGARKENGRWMQSSTYDGVDLPDDYFDYDEFIREEFGGENSGSCSGMQLFWWVVAVITLVAFLLLSLVFY